MSEKIKDVLARQILDSRGNPTIEVDVILESGKFGRFAVPSGASTGKLEACELRDNDKKNYHGKSVLKAVENVSGKIKPKLIGVEILNQAQIDNILIDIDGTKNKSKLGANAILGVSVACAKAAAASLNVELYHHLGGIRACKTPIPMMNILNGGSHADNKIDIQEFMIMPIGALNINQAIRIGAEIFHTLKKILKENNLNTNVGDEGGFAPNIDNANQALDYICQAISDSGYEVGTQVAIALDAAASEFYKDDKYHIDGKILDSDQLVDYYGNLVEKYPIISIEDPCGEDDYEAWVKITEKLGDKIQIVGDDLFVTNPLMLQKGINEKMANAILIKFNQIGTLTETIEAIKLAKNNGYKTIISHRSGETEDVTISHIAVGLNAGQIKTGSLCRSDRVAKYNELIRIAENLGLSEDYAKVFKKN